MQAIEGYNLFQKFTIVELTTQHRATDALHMRGIASFRDWTLECSGSGCTNTFAGHTFFLTPFTSVCSVRCPWVGCECSGCTNGPPSAPTSPCSFFRPGSGIRVQWAAPILVPMANNFRLTSMGVQWLHQCFCGSHILPDSVHVRMFRPMSVGGM